MALFEYEARGPNGSVERGSVIGRSQNEAVEKLSRQGLIVTGIRHAAGTAGDPPRVAAPSQPATEPSMAGVAEAAPPPPGVNLDPRNSGAVLLGQVGRQVKLENLQFFFRQFAAMTKAGVNPAQSLDTLASQCADLKLRAILKEARDTVAAGYPLSSAFQRYPEVFSPLMVSMIRAGESGGFMEMQSQRMADYLQEEINLRNLIRRETFWPKLTLIMSILIILCAQGIIGMVSRSQGTTPVVGIDSPLTRISPWFFIVPLAIAAFLFVRIGLRTPAVREVWDGLLLKIPYVGGVVHGFAMAKFGRAFGALYRGGVDIPEATRLAADSCGNLATRARIYTVIDKLKSGRGITESWRESGAFSPIVLDMAHTGEMTGNLDGMLNNVAEFYEDEGQTKARKMAQIYGVLLLVAVGIYVGYVVINFWANYFSSLFSYGESLQE
jgi:type II secretory pathway component PulF